MCFEIRLINVRPNRNVIPVNQVEQLNQALLVLRHFVDLSARILPILHAILKKDSPTTKDIINANKIIEVYKDYEFDNSTSKMLINSNILSDIQSCFEALKQNKKNAITSLKAFMKEYEKLVKDWKHIELN